MNDYYAILEVPPTATAAEIRRAYRRLARKYHPDLNKHVPGNDQRIKHLNEAYDVLGDSVKRAAYDSQRQKRAQPRPQTPPPTHPQEPKMTWTEGFIGFVEELKKALQED
jgi:curved DNA-binding protein